MDERRQRVLLIVDDNPANVALLREIFKDEQIECDFHWVENGPKMFDFLLKRGDFVSKPSVDLVILDINMSVMSGHQVHDLIRAHAQLLKTRVVMWTTSTSAADRDRALKTGALAHLVKPLFFDQMRELAHDISRLLHAG